MRDCCQPPRNRQKRALMKPPFPSATPTWHNDTYAAISPSRSELSVAGKTVIITGAVNSAFFIPRSWRTYNACWQYRKGSGIGRETAFAFANAGAKRLILLGRNEPSLEETKNHLPANGVSCSTYAASVTDEKVLESVAATAGTWDILVLNAGFITTPVSIAGTHVDDWWQSFEV